MRAPKLLLILSLLTCVAGQAEARERLRIVGSAAGVALIQSAAESFANHWHRDIPGLELTGTALGFKLFCAGVGFEHPDMVASWRAITDRERAECAANGVGATTRMAIGRNATVLASKSGSPTLDISRAELFSALAAKVDRQGKLVSNPFTRWAELDARLPDREILVMAPEPNTSASHAFRELGLAEGCKAHAAVMDLKPRVRARTCRDLRGDGHLVAAAKRESEVIGWLQTHPHAYAITSFGTLLEAGGRIAASALEGVVPTRETLADARYPLTTTLYLYVKDRHLDSLPDLQQLVYELTSENAIAPDGYLARQGLIPLDEAGRNRARDQALRLGL